MKKLNIKYFFIITFIWALASTGGYVQLKNNPRVITLPLESSKELQSPSLANIEASNFLRQFLEQYLNYSTETFWQSQMNLAQLMAPSLAEMRMQEIRKSSLKIKQKNISQTGNILKITELSPNRYLSEIKVIIIENLVIQNIVFLSLIVELTSSDRTIENPWALLVSNIQMQSSAPKEPAFLGHLQTRRGLTSFLTFPCAIENIENPDDKKIKIKITTMNISEIQLTPLAEIVPTQLKASCRDQEFQFEISSGQKEHTLFLNFPASAGQLRFEKNKIGSIKTKDIYDRTIEKVLGVELDD